MKSYEEFFKGKNVTSLGLGLLGRGVGDAEFIAQYAREVIVTDKKTEKELAESVERLKKYPNIKFHFGGHRKEDFSSEGGSASGGHGPDMVIKAAGVRLDSPEIAAARAAGVPVYMSTALFAKFAREAGATIVGVTGTRGKTTVTQMIYHALKLHLGLNRAEGAVGRTTLQGKVVLGGNIRGLSTLALIPEVKPSDIVVLELDSWQLQGFGDLQMSPDIAVFTNLMPDHQNYYGSMDAYFEDKANIYKYQKEGNKLITGNGLTERLKTTHTPCEAFLHNSIPADWKLLIPGEHNRQNAALAKAALESLGLSEGEIKSGLESFEGVEGRLQFVREVNGVKIYNDNNATTPEATIAALHALSNDGFQKSITSIILIMGGSDKGLDMSKLLYEIAKTCKRVILLAGTGTDRIVPLMQDYSVFDSLESAVQEAIKSAESGDTILFSPAFASFGMFKNEYERNDQFLKIVRALS
ncbi:UDP-N-acetylmuramoyl-L-alanine--D-glutamate ligase [Candidatus Kaiserbacteria bacterium]|nr:UDP-N-acetylmuramoyl-L-alanine--D-glutamate ligase [Candidatus Kaiserbacteria bacterium]